MLLTAFALGAVPLDAADVAEGPARNSTRRRCSICRCIPTFENYVDAWTSPVTPFSRFFLNSLWVCSVTMVATTVVSVLAGYAIARFRFAGRDALLLIFLATQMFPSVLLIAPLLTQWRALGLIDTYQALIYSNFSFTVPFTVWMMVGYFSPRSRATSRKAR